MATKDHSLDSKIIDAARREFLEFGFNKASLNRIVKNAGVTSGALYTRYKNKDDLFASLININVDNLQEDMVKISNLYLLSKKDKNVDEFIYAMDKECKMFIDVLFDHYEDCVLLMCKSDGSKVGEEFKTMINVKSKSTAQFFKDLNKDVDVDSISIILNEQFNIYKEILEKGFNKEKAVSVVNTFEKFIEAGWKDLFLNLK